MYFKKPGRNLENLKKNWNKVATLSLSNTAIAIKLAKNEIIKKKFYLKILKHKNHKRKQRTI